MRYFSLIVLCWAFSTPELFAQTLEKKLADNGVVWAVEYEYTVFPDAEWGDGEFGVEILKLLQTPLKEDDFIRPFFARLVLDAAYQGKLAVYESHQDMKPLTPGSWDMVDTVVTFDPETYEEQVRIVRNRVTGEAINAWTVRQVLMYHRDKSQWSAHILGVAPLINKYNPFTYDSIGLRPLFWIKPENIEASLASDDIVWAATLKSRYHAWQIDITDYPTSYCNLNKVNQVKITDGMTRPVAHQIEQFALENTRTKFLNPVNLKEMTFKERWEQYEVVDTVVTFDPETYEERLQIIRRHIDTDAIHLLRTVQSWYFDADKGTVSIQLEYVAPMIPIRDDYGNFIYNRPLYYRDTNPKRKNKIKI